MAIAEANMLGLYGTVSHLSQPAAKHSIYNARVANAGVEAATPDPGQPALHEISFKRAPLDTKLDLGQGEIIDVLA